MRYIRRMFKAGVLTEGDLRISEEGVPQGSVCSPILANIFAHEVIDQWMEEIVKPRCEGKIALFRYADDVVICCRYEKDAQRIREALPKRLEKYKLQLNEEKTKLIQFDKDLARKGVRQGSFDFLGFTFYWARSQEGKIIPKLKTKAKTIKAKLNKVTVWFKEIRNREKLKDIWKHFCTKLRGHIQYYGVSHNIAEVQNFLFQAEKIAFKWLNRRSQKKSFTWEKFRLFMERNPTPKARIVHHLF